MSTKEYERICAQIDVLEPMLERYGGKTLENVVQGLRARIAEADKQRREMDKRQLSLFGDDCAGETLNSKLSTDNDSR